MKIINDNNYLYVVLNIAKLQSKIIRCQVKEINIWTAEQMTGHSSRFHEAATVGLRDGEVRGLPWKFHILACEQLST